MKTAMRAKEKDRLSVIRMIKAQIMNKEIDKGSELTNEEIEKTLNMLVKQRRDSAQQYKKADRPELAENELSEIQFIECYLPQKASSDEMSAAVDAAIASTGAESMKDMGAVMKEARAALEGKTIDGKEVSELVKAKLQ